MKVIKFYYHPTPNPVKVALFLEEAGLDYQVVPVDTLKGEQHALDFRKVNPNGKLPAIEDDGVRVFDSTAILLYLAEKTGKFLGAPEDRGELLSWLMFVATGIGPYSGQAVHFQHAAPEKIDYAVHRYRHEAKRHYAILDAQIGDDEFILGDTFTIVDISAWGWIDRSAVVLGEGELGAFANLKRWFDGISARPAVTAARNVGKDITFKSERDEEALRALFPQNYAAA